MPWIFDPVKYNGHLSTLDAGSWNGLNDHHLVVDRKWVDAMFRSPTEDYYLHTKKTGLYWKNSESLLLRLAEGYRVPARTLNVCEMPLISLRGLQNETHWRIHQIYSDIYLSRRNDEEIKICAKELESSLSSGFTKVKYPDAKQRFRTKEEIISAAVTFWETVVLAT
jgi:hypothetical protein